MVSIDDIFKESFHYSLTLEEAKPELERFLYQYFGIFSISVADRPQTDGKRIFLEAMKSDFKDDKSKLHKNRNMSLYISDLLHELLHIREGSFLIDSRPYSRKFPSVTKI